jgi:IQ domain-containing protein H
MLICHIALLHITGVPHVDDVYLSDYLGIPVLCPEPDVAHLYSSKSGAKRIFSNAGVSMPPGELDIYSLQQVRYDSLQLFIYQCI